MIHDPGALFPPRVTAMNRPLRAGRRGFSGRTGNSPAPPAPSRGIPRTIAGKSFEARAPVVLSNTPKSLFRMLTRWLGPAAPIVSGGITSSPERGGCRGPRSCCRAPGPRGRETKRGKGPQGPALPTATRLLPSRRIAFESDERGWTGSPGTACDREGASARISSIVSRANGTLFVTRAPVDVVGTDSAETPKPAAARRIAAAGTIHRRRGRSTRLSRRSLRGVISPLRSCRSPSGESYGKASPYPPWVEAEPSSPGP